MNNCLGYNFTLQDDLTVDLLVVNSTCAGHINNITAFYNLNNLSIKNTNVSGIGVIQVYNLTDVLVHNETSICSGSSTNINSNDGNLNITIKTNETCHFLNNFNLTEGINRTNSPIIIFSESTSSDGTYNYINYNISNNLTNTVNISFYPIGKNLGSNFKEVRYTSESSPTYIILNYVVVDGNIQKIYLDELGISTLGSNLLQLVYNIPSGGSGGSADTGDVDEEEELIEEEFIEEELEEDKIKDLFEKIFPSELFELKNKLDKFIIQFYNKCKDKIKELVEKNFPSKLFGYDINWLWWALIIIFLCLLSIFFIIWIIIVLVRKKDKTKSI